MTRKIFIENIKLLIELTTPVSTPTDKAIDFYWEELKSYPCESLDKMFHVAKRDCRFFPKLPELIAIIKSLSVSAEEYCRQQGILSPAEVRARFKEDK